MEYAMAQQQSAQLQKQIGTVAQQMQALSKKLSADVKDPAVARDLAMDLREIGMGVQQFNNEAQSMLQQMAQYIQSLEEQLKTHPQPTIQSRGWSRGPSFGGGGGFFSTILSGLGLGVGMGAGEDIANDIFSAL
ncbi:MAG TPA: hypothetical protein VF265_08035 [Nevskiaceae bacterium]